MSRIIPMSDIIEMKILGKTMSNIIPMSDIINIKSCPDKIGTAFNFYDVLFY